VPIEVQHDNAKFALAGLDLNFPVDLVPQGKYSRATNVVSKKEGQMETRDGTLRVANVAASPIHTIFRLAQSVLTAISERLVGAGGQLYSAPLPDGNVFTQLAGGPLFDSGPLSIIQFSFDSDPGGVWAIIANSAGMMKRRSGYYQQLGVPAPTVQVAASAGGAGLLDSSQGTPYDWRYTYVNMVTLSESNGSPIMSSSQETLRPTTPVTPTPTIPSGGGGAGSGGGSGHGGIFSF